MKINDLIEITVEKWKVSSTVCKWNVWWVDDKTCCKKPVQDQSSPKVFVVTHGKVWGECKVPVGKRKYYFWCQYILSSLLNSIENSQLKSTEESVMVTPRTKVLQKTGLQIPFILLNFEEHFIHNNAKVSPKYLSG